MKEARKQNQRPTFGGAVMYVFHVGKVFHPGAAEINQVDQYYLVWSNHHNTDDEAQKCVNPGIARGRYV